MSSSNRKGKGKPFYSEFMPAQPGGADPDYNDPHQTAAGISNYFDDQDRRYNKAKKEIRNLQLYKEERLNNPQTLEDLVLKFGSKEWLNSPVLKEVSNIFFTIKDAAVKSQVEVSEDFISELNKVLSKLFDNADPKKRPGMFNIFSDKLQNNAAKQIAAKIEGKTLVVALGEIEKGFKAVGVTTSAEFDQGLRVLAGEFKSKRVLPIKYDPEKAKLSRSDSSASDSSQNRYGPPSPASTTDVGSSSDSDENEQQRYSSGGDSDHSRNRGNRK
jgi:hypothetical protein